MDLQLGGKRALITGSTAGTGFAIADVLAREGARYGGPLSTSRSEKTFRIG